MLIIFLRSGWRVTFILNFSNKSVREVLRSCDTEIYYLVCYSIFIPDATPNDWTSVI